jgi:lipopolysaccharide/colanic/teichoic acid biosynthesis glycosyltransferase
MLQECGAQTTYRRHFMLSKVNPAQTDNLFASTLEDTLTEPAVWLHRPDWYDAGKGVVEFAVCLVLLLLAAPVVAVAALLVKLTSRGPAFYTQTRLGVDDREYTIYKLRSMYHNCERQSGARWSTTGDPRVTPVGRWLRRTHIDELPQLWNVLRGEMSLMGPRPERPEFIPHLQEALPLYHLRRTVRPGVTGLAQVQLPPDTDLESVRRKLAYDLYYVQHRNLWLDLRLLMATAIYTLGAPYSLVAKLTYLPGSEVVEQLYCHLSVVRPPASQADSAIIHPVSPVVDVEMVTCA